MKIFTIILSIFLTIQNLDGSAFAAATQVTVKVKGLVCAFCSHNIEKSFLKKDAVEKVKIDLDKKIVTITIKDGQELSNEEIKATILNAGYNVTKIER